MYTLQDLLTSGVDIQSEYKVCYYDYDNDIRVCLKEDELQPYMGKTIRYLYCEDNILYIEVESGDEYL